MIERIRQTKIVKGLFELTHHTEAFDRFKLMRLNLPPIAYALLIAHFIFFTIVGGYALYALNH